MRAHHRHTAQPHRSNRPYCMAAAVVRAGTVCATPVLALMRKNQSVNVCLSPGLSTVPSVSVTDLSGTNHNLDDNNEHHLMDNELFGKTSATSSLCSADSDLPRSSTDAAGAGPFLQPPLSRVNTDSEDSAICVDSENSAITQEMQKPRSSDIPVADETLTSPSLLCCKHSDKTADKMDFHSLSDCVDAFKTKDKTQLPCSDTSSSNCHLSNDCSIQHPHISLSEDTCTTALDSFNSSKQLPRLNISEENPSSEETDVPNVVSSLSETKTLTAENPCIASPVESSALQKLQVLAVSPSTTKTGSHLSVRSTSAVSLVSVSSQLEADPLRTFNRPDLLAEIESTGSQSLFKVGSSGQLNTDDGDSSSIGDEPDADENDFVGDLKPKSEVTKTDIPDKKLIAQLSWRKLRFVVKWSPFLLVYKKKRYPWVQISGHQGNFKPGSEEGVILKRSCSKEALALDRLQSDHVSEFIPKYFGNEVIDGISYLKLQDLLKEFSQPSVMDVKIGIRTYLEEELEKARNSPKPRKDMYKKMIEVDPDEPTAEEHALEAVTKPRYMQWREHTSSSASLGFRIEGIKKTDGTATCDFKCTKHRADVAKALDSFMCTERRLKLKFLTRLREIRAKVEDSQFFKENEVVGSSLLFVHDPDGNFGIWLIDFGKTTPLPKGIRTTHRAQWNEGNHEEGYLTGVDNLIDILSGLLDTSLPENS